MASTTLAKVILLLFMALAITSVSATKQLALKEDYAALKLPYVCREPTPFFTTYPSCCPSCHHGCPGEDAIAITASNATKLLGTINIILEDDRHKAVQALVDLNTRRNFITSTLIQDLGLGGYVRNLADTDVHSIEIGGCNVTITEFVLLTIGTGVEESSLPDQIFEVVPIQKSEDEELVLPNLVISLTLLYEAGALAINPAIFTGGSLGDLDPSIATTGAWHDRHRLSRRSTSDERRD